MKRRIYAKFMVLIPLLCLLLAGCWDSEEITSLAPLSAIGVDQGSGPGLLRISAQVSVPSNGPQGESASSSRLRVLTVEADSLQSAFAAMQSKARRKLFFLHLNFIVFGEEIAKNGIGAVAEAFFGWHTIRGSTLVFTARGNAEEILRAHSGIGRSPGDDITDIIHKVTTSPVARKITINKMVELLSKPKSIGLTMPILNLMPLALSSADETSDSDGGDQLQEAFLDGTALFRGGRWAGELSLRETQTFAALVGDAKKGVSTLANPINSEGLITLQYQNLRIKHKLELLPGEKLRITISPQIQIRLEEVSGGYDLMQEGPNPIERAVKEDVRKRVLNLAHSLQSQGFDALNLGHLIQRKLPKLWREVEQDWPRFYATVEFDSKPEAKLRTTGLLKSFRQLVD